MTANGFGLEGVWREAADRIVDMCTEGVDPRDTELPVGPWSSLGVERYAREYCKVSPRSALSIIYGVCSVAVCVAGQGAWVLHCPIKGGGWLKVPLIQHFVGVAPSGWRKSTALDVAREPLKRALTQGVRDRVELINELLVDAKSEGRAHLEIGETLDDKQFSTIYKAGVCGGTLLRDPTVEALRDFAISNGGVVAVFSGEADVFRNISAYSNDAGSLTFFLDLWQQEGISTARVSKGHLQMEEVALLLAVLFQTDVFTEVTGGTGPRGGGADSFVSRGMFGRIWVVEATEQGGFEAIAQQYADEDDFNYYGDDGMGTGGGERSALGWAMYDYEKALGHLVADSNRYRLGKALRREWEEARVMHGTELQVPEVPEVHREVLTLDPGARLAYRRVQRMQLAFEAGLERSADEDAKLAFSPLAARFTQHVMREALVMTLGANRRVVTGECIQDAATRLLPWRIAHTAHALLKRRNERAADVLAHTAQANPKTEDLSPPARALAALARMGQDNPELAAKGFPRGQIVQRVLHAIPKASRAGVGSLVSSALYALATEPSTGVTLDRSTRDAIGNVVERFVLDPRVAERLL